MMLRSSRVQFSRLRMLAGAGCAALMIGATLPAAAAAQSAVASFNIPSASLSQSLLEFGRQAGISIAADQTLTAGLRGRAVSGDMPVGEALDRLLVGTGLRAEFSGPNAVRLVSAGQRAPLGNAPPSGQDGGQDATFIEDIIVTAQKREESIQDVPIAVSAFSAEMLDALNIEGGSELLRAIPNVSFSKANFSMYNFSIRGIGTKAVSSSSDPAVAVSFNNTPLTRNRLFEQEYLDVNRVEVLRGPQGTLYGRNATGGVVNMIPNLPGADFDAMIRTEVGNYGSMRGQMMVNIPLTDTFWVRGAASVTKRDGFDYNTFTERQVNNRDLFTTRFSAAWEPNDRFKANLIWEHFGEDDERSRTGKQLCTKDPGPTMVGNTAVTSVFLRNRLSQGCAAQTLFSDSAYDTPNGGAFSHLYAAGGILYGNPAATPRVGLYAVDYKVDPYAGVTQSRDLREIASAYDPKFQAQNDVVQLNLELKLSDNLSLISQTAYAKDDFWSTQDYNRFVSNPIFRDSSQRFVTLRGLPAFGSPATPGGVYTDPQLGPSDRMISADLSMSDNRQWSQEFRLQSDYEGSFNFSLGANYQDFKTEDNYYVFNNLFSLSAEYLYNQNVAVYATQGQQSLLCDATAPVTKECVYVDPTPIGQLAGDGHNYFRSKNAVKVRSWAVFGESYWNVTSDLRMTVGLRYTEDKKITTPYPSQLLLGASLNGAEALSSGGYVSRGYPAQPDIEQSWGAVTGRFVLDWKPDLSFTDDTLFYASYARGYKGGGTNPPRVDINPKVIQYQPLAESFDPEYVNAFEIGTKNTFNDGRIRLNANAFYYDYRDYQVSQIVDRISLNENFDARIWGVELEGIYNVTDRFRIDSNVGYLNTRIADGEGSIDVMNRTQGNTDWMVVRPWVQVPSNCIAPTKHIETILKANKGDDLTMSALQALCSGSKRSGGFNPAFQTFLPLYTIYGFTYDGLTEAPNGGRGFMADLAGNELPNSPNWTANVGAQYIVGVGQWDLTVRGDYYWQDRSYARIFNTEYDRLKSWDNANISIVLENAAKDLALSIYVKNVFDETPITDMFTNSDDTGLTANVFTLDPRLIAFSAKKRF